MADGSQDIGTGTELVFANNHIRADITVTTGGTAAGVSVAEWALFDVSPSQAAGSLTPLASKTVGDGVSLADGATGEVVASLVLQPADTAGLFGDYYHEMKMTVSGDIVHVTRGTIRLQKGAL